MTVSPSGVSGGAWIDPSAVVASDAVCMAGAWIGPEVTVGGLCTIGPGAVIGLRRPGGPGGAVQIGHGAWIGPHVSIEPGVTIGPDCVVEADCFLRGGTVLEPGVRLGVRCSLMGDCRIGEYASLYAEVHVCQFATVGPHSHLMPGVVLLNDPYPPTALHVCGPTIGPCAVVGVGAVIWPGVRLGYHAMVASLSEVRQDVDDYILVRGQPAKPVCDTRLIRTKIGDKWVYPFPWMRHNIPDEDITRPVERGE